MSQVSVSVLLVLEEAKQGVLFLVTVLFTDEVQYFRFARGS